MLLEMLRSNEAFQLLPQEDQRVFAILATPFESSAQHLYITPKELVEVLDIGSEHNWFEFLNMDIVRQYVKAQVAFALEIGQRKSLPALVRAASQGDVQAAKMVNDLSGVFNSGERNRTILMHRIVRPSLKPSKPTTIET